MKLNENNKTAIPKIGEQDKKWLIVDAEGLILGRLATRIASILRGKDKPTYTPFFDNGDFIIVINANKIKLSGNKEEQKVYYRHSGWMGGIKETSYQKMMESHPDRILKAAVKGMLPKNKLNRKILKKLKIYSGVDHNHKAQQPETLTF